MRSEPEKTAAYLDDAHILQVFFCKQLDLCPSLLLRRSASSKYIFYIHSAPTELLPLYLIGWKKLLQLFLTFIAFHCTSLNFFETLLPSNSKRPFEANQRILYFYYVLHKNIPILGGKWGVNQKSLTDILPQSKDSVHLMLLFSAKISVFELCCTCV